MPIGALAGAALISGGISAVKGIIGGIQSLGARKKQKELWNSRPTYERPDEANEMLDLYRKQAARTELPGQKLMENKFGATTASGIRQVNKAASSSTSALSAITDIYGKEQEAVRDLGIQFAQYKAMQEQNLAQGLGQAAQYSDQEFQYNKQQPWDIKMNEASSRQQAGAANLWGGIEGMGSAALDFAGTKYAIDALKPPSGTSPTGASPASTNNWANLTLKNQAPLWK